MSFNKVLFISLSYAKTACAKTTSDFMDRKRSQGRPLNSWNGCVDDEANVLGIINWQKLSEYKASFRRSFNATMRRNSRPSHHETK